MKLWLLFIPLFLSQPVARAALKWDRQQVEIVLDPGETTAEAKFSFINEGSTTVTIESLNTSCGCTTAALDKKSYLPGEKGEVRALFSPGQLSGVQSKTIGVKIAGEPNPTVLTLVVALPDRPRNNPPQPVPQEREVKSLKETALASPAAGVAPAVLPGKSVAVKIEDATSPSDIIGVLTVPDLLKIEPLLVVWENGEANDPKKIAIRSYPGQSVRVLKVTSTDPRIRTQLDTGKDGTDYVISVTPEGTGTPSFASLNIESTVGNETKTVRAFAQVKPAAP